MPKIKINQGFTLIELIIVIAIIGILATAVLTGTDFLDQRIQAEDLAKFNRARQFHQAIDTIDLQNPKLPAIYKHNQDFTVVEGGLSIIQDLRNKGYLSSNIGILEKEYKYFTSANYNIVAFSLASKRYRDSMKDANSIKAICTLDGDITTVLGSNNIQGYWLYPVCGPLR